MSQGPSPPRAPSHRRETTARRFLTAHARLTGSPNARAANLPAADFDKDCDVDVADFAHFSACVTGSGIPCTQGCCDADLDGDGDVDLADFSAFTACFNGSNGSGQDTWYDRRALPEHMYEILCEIPRHRGIECPGEQR